MCHWWFRYRCQGRHRRNGKQTALVKTNLDARPIRDTGPETLKTWKDALMKRVNIIIGSKSQVEEAVLHFGFLGGLGGSVCLPVNGREEGGRYGIGRDSR